MDTPIQLEAFLIESIAASIRHVAEVARRKATQGGIPPTPLERVGMFTTDLRSRTSALRAHEKGDVLYGRLCDPGNYLGHEVGYPATSKYIWACHVVLKEGTWTLHADKAQEMFRAAREKASLPPPDADPDIAAVESVISRTQGELRSLQSLIGELEVLNSRKEELQTSLMEILS